MAKSRKQRESERAVAGDASIDADARIGTHPESTTVQQWGFVPKLIATLAILYHLSAVIISPLSGPPPASDMAWQISRWPIYRPYTQCMAINNGYRFFAPNPGPGHIVRYEIDLSDGDTVTGHFPDRKRHWPRLLYHRHFMLSETVFERAIPVASIPATGFADEAERASFDSLREQAGFLLKGLARQLLDENRDSRGELGRRIRIYSIAHGIPTPDQVNGGMKLDDPSLYIDAMSNRVFDIDSKTVLAGYSLEELQAEASP